MYERLVWALPKRLRKPVKAGAGWTLRLLGLCRLLPVSIRFGLARFLGFRVGAIRDGFDAISSEQLAKTVLFLSLRPHTREAKLAEAARFAGWRPMLVYAEDPRFDAGKFFDFHAKAGGLLQLLLTSWLFRGPVIHVFAPDGAQAYLLCVAKTRPLILDINDTLKSHLAPDQPDVWVRCEKDAIRAADGMTHRDMRVKYLQKSDHYPLPRNNCVMMDLVPEVAPRARPARRGDEIHVVSVGWIGRGENSILRSIKMLCENRIHVHLYINPLQRETDPEISEYAAFRDQSPYFHFEEAVFGEAYWDQLSKYDLGLIVFEPFVFGGRHTAVTGDSLRGAGSSRLTDYMLTGLGVIMTPGLKFQHFLARRYAPVVVPITGDFFRHPRPVLEAALARKDVARPRSLAPITTRGVARRLGEFYSRVARAVPS